MKSQILMYLFIIFSLCLISQKLLKTVETYKTQEKKDIKTEEKQDEKQKSKLSKKLQKNLEVPTDINKSKKHSIIPKCSEKSEEDLERDKKLKERGSHIEIDVVDRIKQLDFKKRTIGAEDSSWSRIFYNVNRDQLKDLFPDALTKDNKLKYDELINYILRGITENTAMYDVAEKDRKNVLQKMTQMKREIENLKKITNNF